MITNNTIADQIRSAYNTLEAVLAGLEGPAKASAFELAESIFGVRPEWADWSHTATGVLVGEVRNGRIAPVPVTVVAGAYCEVWVGSADQAVHSVWNSAGTRFVPAEFHGGVGSPAPIRVDSSADVESAVEKYQAAVAAWEHATRWQRRRAAFMAALKG